MYFSKKMEDLSSAVFSQLSHKKAQMIGRGVDVIDFSIGTPDMPPSPRLMEKLAAECKKEGNYVYAINDTKELLEAAALWYRNRFGVQLASCEIVSLLGSQSGFAQLALSLVDPGDVVLAPDPGYPVFSVGPLLAGAAIVKMPLLKENGYLIDLDAIHRDDAKRAKLMVVSYPNNPTAATAPRWFYEKLVAFAKEYRIVILHDNAYCELVFTGEGGESILSIPGAKDVAVEFNSLSKTYSLPGCRIAFAMGNKEIIGGLRTIKSHVDYGMFLPLQKMAIEAITGPQDTVEQVRQLYEKRGKVLVNGLRKIGWNIDYPMGSMFVWAKIPDGYSSSVDFAVELMEKARVIVVPGSSFGQLGEGFVRIALVQTEDRIKEAVDQIAAAGIIK